MKNKAPVIASCSKRDQAVYLSIQAKYGKEKKKTKKNLTPFYFGEIYCKST